MPSAMMARRLVIRGRVQGVGFRYAMLEAAASRGVTGWVRNRRDGSVEALVQGEADELDAVVAWCRRGPPAARVLDVEVHVAATEARSAFDLLPTA
jgi:acylphosphatase